MIKQWFNQSCINMSPDYQNNYTVIVAIRMQFFYIEPKLHRLTCSANNTQNSSPNAFNPDYENCTMEFKEHIQAKQEL